MINVSRTKEMKGMDMINVGSKKQEIYRLFGIFKSVKIFFIRRPLGEQNGF